VGVTPEVNAVSTLLLAVTIVPIVFAHRLLQGSPRPEAARAEP
jgi:ABC-type spermidine/putrescine transport system permease subunit II